MRVRTNIILAEEVLKKIDIIAGEKQKRAAVIETALREYIEREEAKAPVNLEVETVGEKAGVKAK
jgi:metal-responsive CopG/Arc/MetJ family transcriptional regulator